MINRVTKTVALGQSLKEAAAALSKGLLVSFPTETVYGLGANAFDAVAVNSIFEAKMRPSDNPLIVHISDKKMLKELVLEVPDFARPLMKKFWPGPLTLVMKKTSRVPAEVTAGLDTVAVRIPSHPTALKLLKLAKVPVAAPSANISGKPSPTCANDVVEDLTGRVDFIIDGGVSEVGIESTVLDVTVFPPVILRPGSVTSEQIALALGLENLKPHCETEVCPAPPKAPGMKYKHYSPDAEMTVFCGDKLSIVREIMTRAANSTEQIGIMATEQTLPFYFAKGPKVISVGDRNAPDSIAKKLFSVLRRFDKRKVSQILAEGVERSDVGDAIMNRLTKAASDKVVDVETAPFKILFVCTGNTCRSIMAEGIMKKIALKANLNIEITSAGANANNGDCASQHAIDAVQELFGVDISKHEARHLTLEILQVADLVLTMEKRHYDFISAYVSEESYKSAVLPVFVASDELGVIDPFGGSLEIYKATAQQIFANLTRLRDILLFNKSE